MVWIRQTRWSGKIATAFLCTILCSGGFLAAQDDGYGPPSLGGDAKKGQSTKGQAKKVDKPPYDKSKAGKSKAAKPPRPMPKKRRAAIDPKEYEIPAGLNGPKFRVDQGKHDWGSIIQGTVYKHSFQIHNDGDYVLKILNVKPG